MLGYAEQHYWRALADELTARELVALQPGLAGEPRDARLARADELLERVGLLDRREAHPRELSGGEQQRVAVCAALAHRPRLFLADEPTGELDAENATILYRLIGELVRAEGATALLVSHDPQSASIADRIVHVRDGRVSEEATRADGRNDAIVVGKGGWLRLSEELLRHAGIGARAAVHAGPEGIVVTASGPRAEDSVAEVATLTAPPAEKPGSVVAEARAVTRRYGQATALDEVSASFATGRLTAVTGPSGSGKTTLLHLLAGLDLPTDGDVLVDGIALSALDRTARAEFRRGRVALIGQEPGLVPFLTASENVALGLDLRGLPESTTGEALQAVGLGERADEPVSVLSAGERERVAIARALAARPVLLLADEPTARLDQANALAVASLFSRLAREHGASIVCATHDPLMIEHADEVVALGRL
jgi:ABC-type lipoprotein export system ATPase subunit